MSERGDEKPFGVMVETSTAAQLGCLVGSHGWGGAGRLLPPDASPGEAEPVLCFADGGELALPVLPACSAACRARGRHVRAVLSATGLSKPREMHLAQAGTSASAGTHSDGFNALCSIARRCGGRKAQPKAVCCPLLCCKEADQSPGFAVRFCSAVCLVGLLCLTWYGAARKAP